MVASLLEGLGVYLGTAEELFDPLPDEPRSHWEHRSLRVVNDTLLARHGGGWDDPPVLPLGWEHATALADLGAQGQAHMTASFAGHPAWGWKDPRTCLTLPFWRRLQPDARYIICLRHPIEVARSLRARDGFTLAHGLRLWLAYTAAAVVHTDGQPRLFLFYDDVLRQPAATVSALGHFVGASGASSAVAIARVAQDRRHHHYVDRPRAHGYGEHTVMPLYAALRNGAPVTGALDADGHAAMTAAAADALRADAVAAGGNRPARLQSTRRALAASIVRVRNLARRRTLHLF